MITGPQIMAARALLGWDQIELCRRSGVSRDTLSRFEGRFANPRMGTIAKLVRALSEGGCELIDEDQGSQGRGVGVRLLR